MSWLINNLANIVVIILVIALLYACIRSLYVSKKKGVCCGCSKGCTACSKCSHTIDLKKVAKNV